MRSYLVVASANRHHLTEPGPAARRLFGSRGVLVARGVVLGTELVRRPESARICPESCSCACSESLEFARSLLGFARSLARAPARSPVEFARSLL